MSDPDFDLTDELASFIEELHDSEINDRGDREPADDRVNVGVDRCFPHRCMARAAPAAPMCREVLLGGFSKGHRLCRLQPRAMAPGAPRRQRVLTNKPKLLLYGYELIVPREHV